MSGSAPPLVSVCKAGQAQALLALLAQCPRPPPALVEVAFLAAVEHGHAAVLAPLLALLQSPVPSIHRRADPVLVVAAHLGHADCVRFLLAHVPVDQPTKDAGRTALMAAAEHGHGDVVAILLRAKADVGVRDCEGFSALHVAAAQGDAGVVQMLLEAGATVTALNEDGESPLELAGNCDVARTILEARIVYPEERPESSCSASSCYAELRSGPGATLFWSAVGVGRDNLMFQQFGVYPFDRLNDTERILILTEVCEVIAGYRAAAAYDILRESARFAVFAMIKSRIKKEIDAAAHVDPQPGAKPPPDCAEAQFEWRRKVTAAFESIFQCRAADVGLTVDCVRRVVWNTVVNMIAKQTDRDSAFFWDKRRVFSCSNGPERPLLVAHSGWVPPDGYFAPALPPPQQLTQQQVQITFKKLMTMTKSYLMEDDADASGCFCQECVAEREVPLSFKLQFLDENAHGVQALSKPGGGGARKQLSARGRAGTFFQLRALENCSDLLDKFAKRNAKKAPATAMSAPDLASMMGPGASASCCPATSSRLSCPSLRDRCDDLLLTGAAELRKFWCNLSTEEKWLLTEISTHELADLIAESRHHDWESLRAALHSYSLYQWEEDLLEISDDVVTISDDMSESKDLNDLVQVMVHAAVRVLTCPDVLAPAVLPAHTPLPAHARECLTAQGRPEECQRCLSDEEWDRRGRQQLESIVLCEFARKVACSYMYASEASRAQRIALELELELLQEEEQLMKLTEKKHKRRKAKSRKKKGKASAATTTEPERDATPPQSPSPAPPPESESDTNNDDDDDETPLPIPVTASPPTASATTTPSITARPPRRKPVPAAAPAATTPVKSITILAPKRHTYENGMMFICTDDTYGECQSLGIFGLPRQHLNAVLECRPGGGTALFLFNISTRLLHGLFEPTGLGQDTIHATAWSRPHGQQTPFPAQVAFRTVHDVQRMPLPEPVFRHIFPDGNRIRKLSGSQVQALLQVWDQYGDKPAPVVAHPQPPLTPTPPRKASKRVPGPKSAPRPSRSAPPQPAAATVVVPHPKPAELARPAPVVSPQPPFPRPTAAVPILPSSSIWAPNAPASSSWSRSAAPSPPASAAAYCPPPGFAYGACEPSPGTQSRTGPGDLNGASSTFTNRLNLFGDWNGIWSSPAATKVPSAW